MAKKRKKVLLVVDGMNILHRGHYVTPPMNNAAGIPTNAMRGMTTIMMADIKRVGATHCAVIFDRPGDNFRHRLYPEYKATREKLEDALDLNTIVGITKRLINAMGIKVYGTKGVEGDDLIGSAAVRGSEWAKVFIDSNDKDFASLVNDRIRLLKPKGITLDAAGVFDTYGVHPHQMVEYLMMLGDTVDNIPGINKVGPVTAAKWLSKHKTLRNVLRDEKFTAKMQPNIDAARPFFSLSKKLITLKTDFLENMEEDHVLIKGPQPSLKPLCAELEFNSTYSLIVNTLR